MQLPLPRDLLVSRLKNEIRECRRSFKHYFSISDPDFREFPVTIMVTLVNTPGPVLKGDRVGTRYTHKLRITITEDYPFQTPIVRWRSKIFHPNIMPPSDGGYICTKLLDEWSFRSTLPAFIRGIESLLLNPNPDNPYDNDTCTKAAEYFNRHPYNPPLADVPKESHRKPVVIGDENGDKNNRRKGKKS
jgi:ubiquitin-protein ligase